MQIAPTNSANIAYEAFGKKSNPCLVMIMGLGEQMVAWPDAFCKMLAANNLYVIRFDNRDTGRSSKFDDLGLPDLNNAWTAYFSSAPINPPYSLRDMATDVIGLLQWIGIEKATVCGFSMGGMIAQNMAFEFSEYLSGMICMGSTTGERSLPPPSEEAQQSMAAPPPQIRADYIEHSVSILKTFSAGSKLYDTKCRRNIAAASFDRCFYPQGFMRQSVAMLADGSRKKRLEKIKVPTLVLQGELDPVAKPEHGKAIRDAVSGSKFVLIPQWGHGLDYPNIWPTFSKHILDFHKSIS